MEIRLKSCPKTYVRETHRSRTPEETRLFVNRMKSVLEMRDFREISSLDRIGIPVFTCHRVRPDGSRTDHTGKGLSPVQAEVSLTMESVERYSSEYRDGWKPGLVRGSFRDLSRQETVLDPEDLILPRGSSYTPDRPIHWVRGYDLLSGENILVPAFEVYHPFPLEAPPIIATHTNGIASGNTLEEAVFHGLTEVIERDAWSLAKYREEPGRALYLTPSEDTRFITEIVGRFDGGDVEVVAKDITSDLGVPVVAAFSRDLVYRNMIPIDGFGSHLDPRVALARALLEIATTRGLFFQKLGPAGAEAGATGYVGDNWNDEDWRFLADEEASLDDVDARFSEDILTDIETVLHRLREKGFRRAVAVDLTRDETKVPTGRFIVPGKEGYCFCRSRRGRRLTGS